MRYRLAAMFAMAVVLLSSVGLVAAEPDPICLTILYDNYVYDEKCEPDWGFACLVTGTEKAVLFDTGKKGDLLLENARKLDVNLDGVELVVISHNHSDHSGGLPAFLAERSGTMAYLPAATPEKMVKETEANGAKTAVVTKPVEICEDVVVLGPIGEKIVEQALVIDTRKGLIVVTGCSHPGIVEIAGRARQELGREIRMIVGGMHLLKHSEEDLQAIVRDLKELRVRRIAATHCTGDEAIALFEKEFGPDFVKVGVGRVLEFSDP